MRDIGNKDKDKGKENIFGAIMKCILEIGKMIICMDKDNCFWQMGKIK